MGQLVDRDCWNGSISKRDILLFCYAGLRVSFFALDIVQLNIYYAFCSDAEW